MNRVPNSNEWQVTLLADSSLQGRRVQFKFVIGGSNWVISHSLPKVQDDHGNENNFFELGDSHTSFDTQHQVFELPNLRVERMLMNKAHKQCTENEAGIFMHTQTDDTLVVVRQLPIAYSDEYDAYVSVQRFPFKGCNDAPISTTVELPGFLSEVVFAANIVDHHVISRESESEIKS